MWAFIYLVSSVPHRLSKDTTGMSRDTETGMNLDTSNDLQQELPRTPSIYTTDTWSGRVGEAK